MKKAATQTPLFFEHLRALCAAVVLGLVVFSPYFASAAEDVWVKGSLVRHTGGGALYQFTKAGSEFRAKAVALSDDGSKLVAYTNTTAFEPGYFVSADGGATWTDRTYASGAELKGGFRFGAVSGDGSRFFALEPVYQNVGGVVHTGYALKVSFDNGATWGGLTFPVAGGDNARYASNRCFDQACRAKKMSMDQWGPIHAISRDGGKLLYIANWSGDDSCSGACQSIWISNDGGNSWFKSKEWKGGSQRKALSMTMSPAYSDDSNTIMLVGASNGVASDTSRLFFSRDGGVSWNEYDFGGSITGVAAPGNGATMIVARYNTIYKSTDGGTSWSLDTTVPANATAKLAAISGNGAVVTGGVLGDFYRVAGPGDFDGRTRVPLSFDAGRTWNTTPFPELAGGVEWDASFGVSRSGNKMAVASGATVLVGNIAQEAATAAAGWTQYCTGGSDPNGNNWQWWEKSNTNPVQYRFVRWGDGTCTALWQKLESIKTSVPVTAPAASVPTPAVPAPVAAEVRGTISATACVAALRSTCAVSVTWTSTNSKDNWTQVNVVKPDGTTMDSYKVQRANSSHTFNLPSGEYAIALIGFQQNDTPTIIKSASVTVGVAATPTPAASVPAPVSTVNKIPFGYLDSATCTEVKGWAYDSDNQNAAVTLHVYEGSTFVTSGTANLARADVNRVMSIVGDHGFVISLPAKLKDGKAHTLTVYALDTAGGKSANLQQSPRTVTCAAAVAPVSLVAAAIIPFTVAVDMLSDLFFALGV